MSRWDHRVVFLFVLLMGCARSAPPAGKVGAGGEQPDLGAAQQGTLTDSQNAEIAKADAAIADYTALIARDPDHARDAYEKRGEAYRRKGMVIADFARYPGHGEWEARRSMSRDEFDKAIADFTAALKLAPDDASILFKRALAHFDKEDYRRGMADYTEAVRRDPKLARAFGPIARDYPEDGSPIYPYWLRDIADLSDAIRLDPKKADAYDSRAHIYQNMEEYERAIADYSEAFRLDPKNPDIAYRYSNRGFCYLRKQDYDNAIADFTEAIRLVEKDRLAELNPHESRGLAYVGKKEFAQAVSDFTEAIRVDPKQANAYVQRGAAYAEQSQYDVAFADFSEAIRLNPKSAAAHQELGRAYYIRGVDYSTDEIDRAKAEYDKAIAACSEAIRLDPKNVDAYFTRARAHKEKWLLRRIRGYPRQSTDCLFSCFRSERFNWRGLPAVDPGNFRVPLLANVDGRVKQVLVRRSRPEIQLVAL